jgi:hypothetical protein
VAKVERPKSGGQRPFANRAVGGEVAPQLVIRLETTAKWAFPTTMGQSGGADRGLPVPRVLFLSGYQM